MESFEVNFRTQRVQKFLKIIYFQPEESTLLCEKCSSHTFHCQTFDSLWYHKLILIYESNSIKSDGSKNYIKNEVTWQNSTFLSTQKE